MLRYPSFFFANERASCHLDREFQIPHCLKCLMKQRKQCSPAVPLAQQKLLFLKVSSFFMLFTL